MIDLSKIQYYENITESIGNTPLIRLNKIGKNLKAMIFAKAEHLNPSGSVKDRIGLAMIEEAERSGRLRPGGTIVEATGGNTGASLALVAACKGYKTIFTMPDKMSQEKVRMLKALGSEVMITPSAVPPDSPEYYVNAAKRIHEETPNSMFANQFFNPANPEAHYHTTGPELWTQTGGQIDYFVAGMGTGGTVSGVARYLKEKNPKVRVIVADPIGSVIKDYFYTKHIVKSAPWKVEGIGEDMIPPNHHYQYIDEVIQVTDKDSFICSRRLAREEGLLVGGSSGTALAAALKLARTVTEQKLIVFLLPDAGDRYISKFHSDEWMKENRFLQPEKVEVDYVLTHKSSRLPALVHVNPDTKVSEVVSLMDEYNISQVPVLDGNRCVGNVSDNRVTKRVLEDRSMLGCPVRDLMEPALPEIESAMAMDDAVRLLMDKSSAVLVKRHDVIVGILTRHDLISYLAK
ncbi:MAG TPA: cystathionine beta-synthase [Acidobacteriota bacterium]|nr:cystathionine beta-synthase [Acidobacteriota bacterium]